MKFSFKLWQCVAFAVLAAFFALFLVYPVAVVIGDGCDPEMIAEVFRNRIYAEGLVNAARVAAVTTLFAFLIAMPLALIYDRYEFPGKKLCFLAIMAPMVLPPFVGALGFQQLLGHYGVFNSILARCGLERIDFMGGGGRFWAVCAVEALHLYPVMYLNIAAALANVDPALQEAARNLSASPWRRFRKITLPLVRPGVFAGGSIVLIWSFTELGTPLMFNFDRITPVQVFSGITELERNRLPLALVLVMLAVSGLLYLTGKFIFGRAPLAGNSGKGSGSAGAGQRLTSWRKFLPAAAFGAVTITAVLPHVALVLAAFSGNWYNSVLPSGFTLGNFENALSDPLVLPSIVNSLKYSVAAMVLAVAAGTLTAFLNVRCRVRGGWLLDAMAMLPLAVPGVVMAFGFVLVAYSGSVMGAIFDIEHDPLVLLAVAYAVRRLPYVVRSVSAGLEQMPEDLALAGRNLGAGALTVMRRITLPLIAANMVVGGLFAFSFSMLEVSDSLILAHKEAFYPITKAIYALSQVLGGGRSVACAFGVWAMLFLGATLIAAGVFLGRKLGSVFRM